MSVIRQPGLVERNTRRRIVGTTAALSAATFEALAVGIWYLLVVLETRTTATALAGLGLLFCGSLLRTGVFGVATRSLGDLFGPRRLAAAVLLTTGWVLWLLVAEIIGDSSGLIVGGVLLGTILSAQLLFERRIFRCYAQGTGIDWRAIAIPATLLAIGASTLLASTWFSDWGLTSEPLSIGATSVFIRIEAFQLGFIVFVLFAFLAHQRRFQQTLDP